MKTVEDAVRELDGKWPEEDEERNDFELVWAGDKYRTWLKDDWLAPDDSWYAVCDKDQFQAAAARMGYPRVTLLPGDYVRCEDVSGQTEYSKIAEAFMAAGAEKDEYPAYSEFKRLGHFGWVEYGKSISEGLLHGNGRTLLMTRQLTSAQVLNAVNAGPQPHIDTGTGWHERGELPPVGEVCECSLDFNEEKSSSNWNKIEVLYSDESTVVGRIIEGCHASSFSNGFETDLYEFRPIRTDRERWADRATSLFGEMTYGTALDVHDALLSGELPTPGGDK